jgi:predicted dienelactone hydrolase
MFLCKEKPGVDPVQVHVQTQQMVLAFFNRSLRVK